MPKHKGTHCTHSCFFPQCLQRLFLSKKKKIIISFLPLLHITSLLDLIFDSKPFSQAEGNFTALSIILSRDCS